MHHETRQGHTSKAPLQNNRSLCVAPPKMLKRYIACLSSLSAWFTSSASTVPSTLSSMPFWDEVAFDD